MPKNRPRQPTNLRDQETGRSYSLLPKSPFRMGGEAWDRDVAMRERLAPSLIPGVGVVVTKGLGLRLPVLIECLHPIPLTREGKIARDPDCTHGCRARANR